MENYQDFHFAILGLGKIARKFAHAIYSTPQAKLVTVGSRSISRARAFAKEFGATYASGTYEGITQGPRIDAVYIATPHISHYPLVKWCLEQNLPVICEKPLAMSYSQVEELVNLSRQRKVYLLEALWTRFLPSTLQILSLIEQGVLGSIESVRSDFGFRALGDQVQRIQDGRGNRILDPALGGGALLDIGIYPVFLSQLLLGEPEEINAMARFSTKGVDIDTSITARHTTGKLSHSYATILGQTRTEALIIGSKASIHWQTRWHGLSNFSVLRGKDVPPENFNFNWTQGNGYQYELMAAMQDIKDQKLENNLWSLEDSLCLHRTLTRIRQKIGLMYAFEEEE